MQDVFFVFLRNGKNYTMCINSDIPRPTESAYPTHFAVLFPFPPKIAHNSRAIPT